MRKTADRGDWLDIQKRHVKMWHVACGMWQQPTLPGPAVWLLCGPVIGIQSHLGTV